MILLLHFKIFLLAIKEHFDKDQNIQRNVKLFFNDKEQFRIERESLIKHVEVGFQMLQNLLDNNTDSAVERNVEVSDFDYNAAKRHDSPKEAWYLFIVDINTFVSACIAELKEYIKLIETQMEISERTQESKVESIKSQYEDVDESDIDFLVKVAELQVQSSKYVKKQKQIYDELKTERKMLGRVIPQIGLMAILCKRSACYADKEIYLRNIGVLPGLDVFNKRLTGKRINLKDIKSQQESFADFNLYHRYEEGAEHHQKQIQSQKKRDFLKQRRINNKRRIAGRDFEKFVSGLRDLNLKTTDDLSTDSAVKEEGLGNLQELFDSKNSGNQKTVETEHEEISGKKKKKKKSKTKKHLSDEKELTAAKEPEKNTGFANNLYHQSKQPDVSSCSSADNLPSQFSKYSKEDLEFVSLLNSAVKQILLKNSRKEYDEKHIEEFVDYIVEIDPKKSQEDSYLTELSLGVAHKLVDEYVKQCAELFKAEEQPQQLNNPVTTDIKFQNKIDEVQEIYKAVLFKIRDYLSRDDLHPLHIKKLKNKLQLELLELLNVIDTSVWSDKKDSYKLMMILRNIRDD